MKSAAQSEMSLEQMKEFVRDHFEEFVNQKNIAVGDRNFGPDFVDRGADVPPGLPPGPEGAKAYVAGAIQKFPDLHVDILDIIAEGDKVVVRNHWSATNPEGKRVGFSGIVVWRIHNRQLAERWAYLEPIHQE